MFVILRGNSNPATPAVRWPWVPDELPIRLANWGPAFAGITDDSSRETAAGIRPLTFTRDCARHRSERNARTTLVQGIKQQRHACFTLAAKHTIDAAFRVFENGVGDKRGVWPPPFAGSELSRCIST